VPAALPVGVGGVAVYVAKISFSEITGALSTDSNSDDIKIGALPSFVKMLTEWSLLTGLATTCTSN